MNVYDDGNVVSLATAGGIVIYYILRVLYIFKYTRHLTHVW